MEKKMNEKKVPKLIALDLDETTLNMLSGISEGNRAALARAIERGVEIVIASGRAYETLPEEMTSFPGVRYAVCGNGATVYDVRNDACLVRHLVPVDALDRIIALMEGEDITWEAFVAGRAYAQRSYIEHPERYTQDPMTARYLKASRRPVEDILAFIRENRAQLDSVDVVVISESQKDRLMEVLSAVPGVYVTTSVPRLIEISNIHCGKHNGMKWVAEQLGIDRADTAAFGNADNDADMLLWAGTGVAVANASEKCLAAADYVTSHFLKDGVAAAFHDLWGI